MWKPCVYSTVYGICHQAAGFVYNWGRLEEDASHGGLYWYIIESSPIAKVGVLQAEIFLPLPTSSFQILLRHNPPTMKIIFFVYATSCCQPATGSSVSNGHLPPSSHFIQSEWKRDRKFTGNVVVFFPVSVVGILYQFAAMRRPGALISVFSSVIR